MLYKIILIIYTKIEKRSYMHYITMEYILIFNYFSFYSKYFNLLYYLYIILNFIIIRYQSFILMLAISSIR